MLTSGGNTSVRIHAPDLSRLRFSPNLRAISVAEGIRAALAVAVIIAANAWFAWHPLGEAALSALLTCICDPGGPIRRRVPVLLSFTFAGALLIAGIGLARSIGFGVALPLTVAGLFCAALIRIYGQAPQQLGVLLSVVIVLAFDGALPTVAAATNVAAGFIGGGLWATLLTLVIWRIHPYLPARAAVAESYRRLAGLVADLQVLLANGRAGDVAWESHARAQRRAVRDAIEAARTAVMETLRSRGISSNRAAQSLIRLEAADQVFGALIALSDLLEHRSVDPRTTGRMLRRLRPTLLVLARAIPNDVAAENQRVGRAIEAMAADLVPVAANDPLRPIADRILERLRVAHTMTVPQYLVPGVAPGGERRPLAERLRTPLLANLTWRSPALRHALRVVAVSTPALVFTLLWFTPFDHWLTITLIATMQPYYALTYARAVERVAGTLAGGLLAAGIGLVCTSPLSIAVAMFPLAVIALGLRAVSLGFFMFGLTPLIVLLVEAALPHTSEWLIAAARAGFTFAGGVAAVAASFLLWPARAAEDVAGQVREAIEMHGRYAEAELSRLLGEATASTVDAARRAAGLSSNTMEASISHALQEPGNAAADRLEAALVIDAALRRWAGRVSVLPFEHALAAAPDLPAWRAWFGAAMRDLAAGHHTLPARPTAGPETLLRLARQAELMAGVMQRLAGERV